MAEKNEDEIRAKQSISPAGLGDQSVEGLSGPGSEPEVPPLEPDELADEYLEGEGEDVASNVRQSHPNRNLDKPDLDKPAYN